MMAIAQLAPLRVYVNSEWLYVVEVAVAGLVAGVSFGPLERAT